MLTQHGGAEIDIGRDEQYYNRLNGEMKVFPFFFVFLLLIPRRFLLLILSFIFFIRLANRVNVNEDWMCSSDRRLLSYLSVLCHTVDIFLCKLSIYRLMVLQFVSYNLIAHVCIFCGCHVFCCYVILTQGIGHCWSV